MISSCCAAPGNGPKRPASGWRRSWHRSGCSLHPDKTRLVSLADGRDGFDFLGFHHRLVKSWKWRGRYYLNRWPSTRAMDSIRAKVRDRTDRRYASAPMEVIVGSTSTPCCGAGGTTSGTATPAGSSHAVDSYVHQRLARLASIKHGLRGINWGQPVRPPVAADPRHPPAHRNRRPVGCACLTMNDVGEPCAGEPHARFDRGPLARPRLRRQRQTNNPTRGHRLVPARNAAKPAAYLTDVCAQPTPLSHRYRH